jgi:hypothetical protein
LRECCEQMFSKSPEWSYLFLDDCHSDLPPFG